MIPNSLKKALNFLFSNFLSDSQHQNVHLKQAGILMQLFPRYKAKKLTELTLSGPLNNKDLDYLRELCGFEWGGNLNTLDLSDAELQTEEKYTLPNYTFYKSVQLKKIILPKNIERIGGGAFYGCISLKSIYIQAQCRFVDYEAFAGCNKLKRIEVDEKNPYLCNREDVLLNKTCTTLLFCSPQKRNLNIPSTVNSIEDYALNSRNDLRTIYCYAQKPPILAANSLTGVNKHRCTLYVPNQNINEYRSTLGWCEFAKIRSID